MPMMVHITDEKSVAAIRRNGIASKYGGVYALPVMQNHYLTHQWIRELKRKGQRTMVAVYFRIPDDTMVYVGHFAQEHAHVTAAEAVGMLMKSGNGEGMQVYIPGRIPVSSIKRIAAVPQVIGWRYRPDSHKLDRCFCPFCCRPGSIKSVKKRQKYAAKFEAMEPYKFKG